MDFRIGDTVMYIGTNPKFQNKKCIVSKIIKIYNNFLEIKFDLNSSDILFVHSKYCKKIYNILTTE